MTLMGIIINYRAARWKIAAIQQRTNNETIRPDTFRDSNHHCVESRVKRNGAPERKANDDNAWEGEKVE